MSRIIQLEAENIKRLRAVQITPNPDGSLVVIGGDNGNGKTSLLDSIAMALGGKDEIPSRPIREGASKARVILTTDEYVIERTFTGTGTQLVVKNREGVKLGSPQTLLDALTSSVSFDPLSFIRMDAKEQASKLRALAGLDTTKLEEDRAGAYAKRTDVNRDLKAQQVRCDALVRHPDAPAKAVSNEEIFAKLEAAQEKNAANQKQRETVERAATALVESQGKLNDQSNAVAELRDKLKAMEAELETAQEAHRQATRSVEGMNADLANFADLPLDTIREELKAVEATNEKVRANDTWKAEQQKLGELNKASTALTEQITKIDEEKQKLISQAKYPVAGLGFDDEGVTFNGMPFGQSSAAEQLRVSVAIGFAMQPKLKIALIRDGSLLDHKSLALVAETAEEYGGQVWMERVSNGDEVSVILEAGEIKEDRTQSASQNSKVDPA